MDFFSCDLIDGVNNKNNIFNAVQASFYKLKKISQYDIVLICGLYKTGSSLLARIVEETMEFFNPARITNPSERGYSLNGGRYLTKECKLLRLTNEEFISYGHYNEFDVIKMKSVYLAQDYLKLWKYPLLLKDPLFIFTLSIWQKAITLSKKKYIVLFTNREPNSLIEAWQFALYTRDLLKQKMHSVIKKNFYMQINKCRREKIPYLYFDCNEIKEIDKNNIFKRCL